MTKLTDIIFRKITFLIFSTVLFYDCASMTSSSTSNLLTGETKTQTYDVQKDEPNCPGTKSCVNCCSKGRARDNNGCLICDCLETQEESLNTDMHENERWEKDGKDCPGIDHCQSCCPLGRKRDDQGCLGCECLRNGTFDDILISDQNYDEFFAKFGLKSSKDRKVKRAARKQKQLWKIYRSGNNFIVPYIFHKDATSYFKSVIKKAIKEFKKRTCVRFKPRKPNQHFYVIFNPSRGCVSYVGKVFGVQPIYLGAGCLYYRIVIHEMMHTLGFDHEHMRPDRDKYVRIIHKNIDRHGKHAFAKLSSNLWNSYGTSYDYYSVMHYASSAFASGKGATILTKFGDRINYAKDFSYTDIIQINKMYSCPARYIMKAEADYTMIECKDVLSKSRCQKIKATWKCFEEFSEINCPLTCGTCYKGTKYPSLRRNKIDKFTDKLETTTTKPTTILSTTKNVLACKDLKSDCVSEVKKGNCENMQSYMATNCPLSCGFCVISTTTKQPNVTTKETSTITSARNDECKDYMKQCYIFANIGICKNDKHKSYMSKRCKLSCKLCKVEKTIITTTSLKLRKTTAQFTSIKRPITTSKPFTTSEPTDTIKPFTTSKSSTNVKKLITLKPICENKNKKCKAWLKYCSHEKYRMYMKINCKKTCKYCL